MNRRYFIKIISGTTASLIASGNAFAGLKSILHAAPAGTNSTDYESLAANDFDIKDYLHRMEDFDSPQPGDIILDADKKALLESTLSRLKKIQRTIGFGNFYLLDFDSAVKISSRYSGIGAFTKQEKLFLDEIFHTNAESYGFMGEKPLEKMTARILRKDVHKVPGTGNYLYKGQPEITYENIKKQLGDTVLLTSGIRGVMKQFLLFLDKASINNGNLSLASRSLAPPGYSFHGIGDFDVGQKNLGAANFSIKFTKTATCKRLQELGYLTLRYPQGNMLGVRFEPWHIKVKKIKV